MGNIKRANTEISVSAKKNQAKSTINYTMEL
jgi:hypothetical protein